MLFGFQLGREFKLSIAEILSVFFVGKIEYFDRKFLILSNLDKKDILENINKLGGTIKLVLFEKYNEKDIILNNILKLSKKNIGKFNYGVSVFGRKSNLKTLLIKIKKYLKANNVSSRFVNKDFENLSSAQILGENLVKKQSDFTIITTDKSINYFGITIWIQDIESYSKRDYSKIRDMNIGMLPPKLAKIMLNLANKGKNKNIFDPFVGLGTILIEGIYMGINKVYGSDFNSLMVETTRENLNNLIYLHIKHNNNKNKHRNNKELGFKSKIIKFDARDIGRNPIIQKNKSLNIVTEGFLGEIMTKKNICNTRINIQRKNLSKLYEKFFSGLKQANFKGTIIISFPFWELNKKYIYFTEIYDILSKYCKILTLFPASTELFSSKSGSLLYKRKNQLVGREIFKLKIKS